MGPKLQFRFDRFFNIKMITSILSQTILYLKMGFRNIGKYRRKSLQIMVIVFVGSFVITSVGGLYNGLLESLMNALIENTSHGKVYRKGYYQKQEISPLELSITGYRTVIDRLKSVNNTAIFSPSISAGVVLSHENESYNILCQGIEPYAEGKNIFSIYKVYSKAVISGRFFGSNSDSGIIISSYAANSLNTRLGNKIIVFTADSYGSFNAVELEIIGIFDTANREQNENICLMNLENMQKLTGLEDRVTEIAIFFEDILESDSFLKNNASLLKENNLEYYSWKELLGSYMLLSDLFKVFGWILYLIFIVVAAVGITNTVLISVFDRIRDLGTLRAIGFTGNGVSLLLIIEVLLLGFFGSVIGVSLGGYLVYYFSIHGIVMPQYAQDMSNLYSANRIYTSFQLSYLVTAFLISSIVPVLSALYPTLVFRKIKIKDALGYR